MRVVCEDRLAPAIGAISFDHLHDVVTKARRYKNVRLESAPTFHWNYGSDYDGYPLEQFFTISDEPPISPRHGTWSVMLIYESTNDDSFDFEEPASIDRSTAYKYRSAGPRVLTRFKLAEARFGPLVMSSRPLEESVSERIIAKVLELQTVFDRLDAAFTTLEGWVSTGVGIQVFCRGCYHRSFIPNGRVREIVARGLTLDELKAKLACESCGARNAGISPSSSEVF